MLIDIEKELEPSPAPESYVYMFYSAGKIKIGMSEDPVRRLDQLNNAGSAPVQLVWIGFGNRETEGRLHALFAADRLNGEWFALSDEIRAFVNVGEFPLYLAAAERTWRSIQERAA